MEQHTLKNVNNYLSTNIYSYLETSGGQSYNLYLNVVHFFNTRVNKTSVAALNSCFPSLVSNMCCSVQNCPLRITFILYDFLLLSCVVMLSLC
jgi:hypothetical protein